MSHDVSIGDYALLSDCRTAALVGRDGSVDWYCPERFDAPSIFARLLDGGGGHWHVRPSGPYEAGRAYLDDTMVLRTEFRAEGGRATLTDALALERGARGHEIGLRSPRVLVRRLEGIEGEVEIDLGFAPRLEYGLTAPLVAPTQTGAVARGGPVELQLVSDTPLEAEDTSAVARFTVRAGEKVDFALVYRRMADFGDGEFPTVDVGAELDNARGAWTSWAETHYGYEGPYEREVRRSTLVLQALTYAPTGAIVAAPTTSLPEVAGGEGNWDYRYAWLRDLSMTLRALWTSACPDEAARFFHWVDRAGGSCLSGGQLQIMYGVEGERDLTEHTLEHLEGFRGSRPIRVGNDAWSQRQIDVFGEVVGSAHILREQLGETFDPVTARLIRSLADRAAKQWREPDSGMWEARDAERHYVSSKVMCWVALDRAVDLAPRLDADADAVKRWKESRREVRETILQEGWSENAGAYAGAFGSDRLDASVLLMPLVGFLPADDGRMRATVEKVKRELGSEGLVRRWDGDEHGFLLCTYWLVECLARCGEVGRATRLFERATSCANDLGLLSERADPSTGEPWGNFPQAFSHVGLINAAWCLGQADQAPDPDGAQEE